MDNTTYEFFIRRAWKCDRFQHGANTDTWDAVGREFWTYQDAVGTPQENKSKKEFEKIFTEAKTHIDRAYGQLLNTNANNAELVAQFTDLRERANDAARPIDLFGVLRASIDLIIEHGL